MSIQLGIHLLVSWFCSYNEPILSKIVCDVFVKRTIHVNILSPIIRNTYGRVQHTVYVGLYIAYVFFEECVRHGNRSHTVPGTVCFVLAYRHPCIAIVRFIVCDGPFQLHANDRSVLVIIL
jgi:hypothetical protein